MTVRKSGMRKNAQLDIRPEELDRRQRGARELCRLFDGIDLKEGDVFHIMTGGNIDFASNIMWMLEQEGPIERLFIAAWSFSSADLLNIRNLIMNGNIHRLDILTHDVFPVKHPFEHQIVMDMHRDGYVGDYMCHNLHCKFILIHTFSDKYVVVMSSANGTFNPRQEVEVVTLSRDLYDFFDKQVRIIIDFVTYKQSAHRFHTLEIDMPHYDEFLI